MFKIEIEYIKNPMIRKLANKVNQFLSMNMEGPSSKSGRFHPSDEFTNKGIFLHCKRVCWWVVEFCKENKFNSDIQDAMLVAAMLHDYARTKNIWANHGLRSFDLVIKNKLANKILKTVSYEGRSEETKKVSNIISNIRRFSATHMNHWDKSALQPKNVHEYTFAMCDYAASREEILTPILKTKMS